MAFAMAGTVAHGQPMPSASAAAAGPRSLTPAETRDGSSMPGDIRPEDPVIPQVSIPLGKHVAPGSRRVQPAKPPTTSGAVDDSVARCEARTSKAARLACLRALRQQPPMP